MIMAKSEVTGMYILLLMFQTHCYTIQIFIITKSFEAVGDRYGRTSPTSPTIIIIQGRTGRNALSGAVVRFPFLKDLQHLLFSASILYNL